MDFEEFDRLAVPLKEQATKLAAKDEFQLIEARTASPDEIAAAERELNARLPAQYKTFMTRYGGGLFGYVELLPVQATGVGNDVEDVVSVSHREFPDGAFVAVAPVGTGDFWCFPVVDGRCQDSVWFHYHDGDDPTADAEDFLAFVAQRGLQP